MKFHTVALINLDELMEFFLRFTFYLLREKFAGEFIAKACFDFFLNYFQASLDLFDMNIVVVQALTVAA